MEVILEHVRSFSKSQCIPLRPFTLLVGENSSGKSTFLAIVSCVLNAVRFPGNPGFNEEPYNLGTFDTIATHKGGRYGRDDSFSIGFSENGKDAPNYRKAIATYGNDYGNVVLRSWRVEHPLGEVDLTVSDSKLVGKLRARKKNGQSLDPIEFSRDLEGTAEIAHRPLILDPMYLLRLIASSKQKGDNKLKIDQEYALWELFNGSKPPFANCFSFAPIRSKPHRTYDEFSEDYSPEGDHVPTLLARLLKGERESKDGLRIQEALTRFGRESGLFKNIDVKRLGKKASDPFQVQVAIAGPAVNLTDVGYGVSQALPIIVQSVLKATSKVLLLQQPEVHLHPRAQAALGSFFCELTATDDRMFIVETHSDYLVDRVRQEVARGNLSPDKVEILYFHKPNLETSVYQLCIDTQGNVENAPEAYREFFLKEELNLFSRTGV